MGTILAAALDVTDPEPLPADHPLVAMDNCLVVPHIASASPATRGRMAAMAAANLLAGVCGAAPPDAREPRGVRAGRLTATPVRRARAGHPGRWSGLRRERHGSKGWRRAGPIVGCPRLDARGTLEHVPQGGATCLQPSPAPRTRARHPLRWPRIRRPSAPSGAPIASRSCCRSRWPSARRSRPRCSPPSRRRPRSPARASTRAATASCCAASRPPPPTARAACRRTRGSSRPGSSAARAGTPSAGARPTRAGPGIAWSASTARPRRSSTARRPCTGRRACSASSTGRSRPPAAASGSGPTAGRPRR